MTEQEALFDHVFEKHGGLFQIQRDDNLHILNRLKLDIESVIVSLKGQYPLLPNIHFNFINSDSLNASVAKFEREYFIGINLGTYFILLDMYTKMLATPSILQSLGDISLESNETKLNISNTNGNIEFQPNMDNPFTKPLDETRYNYAHQIFAFAMTFLVNHECAHIIRGHVDYLDNSINNFFCWSEISAKNSRSKIPPAVSQTLEMDADSFATNRAFIFGNSCVKNHRLLNTDEINIFESIDSFTFYWSFSIYSMLRLFGFNQLDILAAKKQSHPPDSIRITMIINNIYEIFTKFHLVGEPIIHIVGKGIVEAEKAFTTITYHDSNLAQIVKIYQDKEISRYIFDILENWNNVRPLLERFAYGELPPYVIIAKQ